jgi:hypothetical protein
MDKKELDQLLDETTRHVLGPHYKEILAESAKRRANWNDDLAERVRWKERPRRGSIFRRAGRFLANSAARETLAYIHRNDPQKLLEITERQSESDPSNLRYIKRIAEIYLRTDDKAKAMVQTAYALQMMLREDPELRQNAEKDQLMRDWKHKQTEKEKGETTADEHLKNALLLMLNRQFVEAQAELKQALTAENMTPESSFIFGDLLEASGHQSDAFSSYWNAINTKKIEEGWPIAEHTESRNKVYTVDWPSFPSGRIYVKHYNTTQACKNEDANTAAFRHALGDCVQLMIGLGLTQDCNIDDRTLMFRAAGDKTLLDVILKDPEDAAQISVLAARLLARIHVFGTKLYERGPPPPSPATRVEVKDVVATDSDFFSKKLMTLLTSCKDDCTALPARSIDKLVNEYNPINNMLGRVRRDFYKDHNPRNIVVDRAGNITAIDFESAHLAPCQIDLVSLTEFGADYLTERQRKKIIEAYIKEKEGLLKTSIHRRGFMLTYQYARAHRHFEMVVYRSRDYSTSTDEQRREAELRRRDYHLLAAADAIRILADYTPSQPFRWLCEASREMAETSLKLSSHQRPVHVERALDDVVEERKGP